jgi:hypothetical protein
MILRGLNRAPASDWLPSARFLGSDASGLATRKQIDGTHAFDWSE